FLQDGNPQSLLRRALDCSTEDFLVFVRNPPATLGAGLAEVLPQMLAGGSLHLGSGCVSDVCRVLRQAPSPRPRKPPARIPIGLQFAGRRRILEDALLGLEA